MPVLYLFIFHMGAYEQMGLACLIPCTLDYVIAFISNRVADGIVKKTPPTQNQRTAAVSSYAPMTQIAFYM